MAILIILQQTWLSVPQKNCRSTNKNRVLRITKMLCPLCWGEYANFEEGGCWVWVSVKHTNKTFLKRITSTKKELLCLFSRNWWVLMNLWSHGTSSWLTQSCSNRSWQICPIGRKGYRWDISINVDRQTEPVPPVCICAFYILHITER